MKSIALAMLFSAVLAAQTGPPPPPPNDHALGRLLAKPKSGADPSAVHAAVTSRFVIPANQQPGTLLIDEATGIDSNIQDIDVLVLHVPENAATRVKDALTASGLFDFVEADPVGYPVAVVPNDTNVANQTWIGQSVFDSPSDSLGAWDLTIGSASLIVAVADSGLNGTIADMAGKQVPGRNILTGVDVPIGTNSDTGCNTGHGTAVSGTIGALTNNSVGIAGGAWLSPIMPLVVTNSSCFAYWSDVATAITWAVNHGAKVINLSLWGPTDSSTLEAAIKYAYDNGVSVVAAAGNNANSTVGFPSGSPYVVASVGAVNPSDVLCSFSNFGVTSTIYALGCNVFTTQMNGTYGYWYGTSFSSPIVAAAVALAMAAQPTLLPADIKTLLHDNSDTVAAGLRLNARKLVVAAQAFVPSIDTVPPVVTVSSPAPGSTVSGTVSVSGTATDNVGISTIQFLVDGVQKTTTGSSPFNFSWDSTTTTNASHSLQVRALDAANNVGSASLSVVVSNTVISSDVTPPVVSITSPTSGAITAKSVKVNVSATDDVGLKTLTVLVDKVKLCSTSVSGLSATTICNWNTQKATKGSHSIVANAMDASGNVGTSSTVTMTK